MSDFLGSIGSGILHLVLPSLGTVIAGLVVLVLKRVASKYGIEVTEKQEERLKQIVVDKVHATEEAARRTPMNSDEKAALTINAVKAEADADPTIPNPSMEKVIEKVDATLSQVRAGMPNAGLPGLGKR